MPTKLVATPELDRIRDEYSQLQDQLKAENYSQEAWSIYQVKIEPLRRELDQYMLKTMDIVFWEHDTRVVADIDDPSLPGPYHLTLYVNKEKDKDRLDEVVNQVIERFSSEV